MKVRRVLVGGACLLTWLSLVFAGRTEAREPDTTQALDFRQIIQEAKDRVFPAVVFVKCITETHETGKRETLEISGSGVLISPEGDFLTNWHVVDKAVEVRCLLYDGRAFRARILGKDQDTDLALGRLDASDDEAPFAHAVLGDSTALTEGDFVMAMGAPWGLSRSVSFGIVACTRRYLPGNSEYSLWLQTDASISPGNSGGPLVNTRGEVIGINARGVQMGGDMGFAIPSATIKEVLPHLRTSGEVLWTWTGLHLQPLTDFSRDMYFGGDEGVIVAGADPDSPARRAGFQPKDRILVVDGRPLTARTDEDLPAIRRRLALLPEGKPVRVSVLRGEETLDLELVPRRKGKVEGEELECPRWDVTVQEINQFANPGLYFHRKEGVFVHGVRQPGNASNAGLRTGDILLEIAKRKVSTLDDVRAIHERALADIDCVNRLVLTILRNGLLRQIVLDFSRDYERK